MDPEKMTQEEIEKALEQAALGIETTVEAEPEPTPEPEPETPPEDAPEPEATPAEPAPEPIVDDAEILRSQLSEAELRSKHWERVAGNHAGQLGFLKQRIDALERARKEATAQDAEPSYDDAPRIVEKVPKDYETIKTWAVAQAVQAGVSEFSREYPDSVDFQADIAKYFERSGYDPKKIIEAQDPITAQVESKRILEEAYYAARAEREAARRAELVKKRADQMTQLEQAKKKASPSAAGSSPPPKPKVKTPDEMTSEELDAELLRLTGGRW